ncbi:MAG: hypothetical protein Q8N03_09370 [Ignavibacteria bacterium]|nr:hypothetical protein [Ignavibacteria bacterium]
MMALLINSSQSYKIFITITFVTLFLLNSCKAPNEPTTPTGSTIDSLNNISINGSVFDASTNSPIDSALITINYSVGKLTLYTTSQGLFTTAFTLDTNRTITITITKSGYQNDTTTFFALMNKIYNLSAIKLQKTSTVNPPDSTKGTGEASSIYLLSQSSSSLGVRGAGSLETGRITFEVLDSTGVPIDTAHRVLVNFRFGGRPNGGEYLHTNSDYTDTSGRVSVYLTSGTKAGVVQIIADFIIHGRTIFSQPVNYAIHGGLPDLTHFGLAPQKVNIPGYNINGVQDPITAILGDKYANPVRPGTSAYFTTDGGIIQGSAITDELGNATAILVSSDPRPNHIFLGPGFATVTASTVDENNQIISKDVIVLFSGIPTIQVSPTTFDIPNRGSQVFNYIVSDQNSNPLSEGQTITVLVEGEGVEGRGDVSINLPDTQSPAWTFFSFSITDTDTANVVRSVDVTISTTGPNGQAKLSFGGIVR